MTFTDQVLLSIIDSGLIGIVIVICGYIFNRFIENYKINQNLREELAKKQIEALVPLLNELSLIRGKLDYFLRTVGEQSRKGNISIVLAHFESIRNEFNKESDHNLEIKRISEEKIRKCILDIEELEQHANSMEIRIGENAFWLRDPLYSRVLGYQKAIFNYASHLKAMAQKDISMLMNSNVCEGIKFDSDDKEHRDKITRAEELGERLMANNLTISEFYKLMKKSALW